MPYYIALDIGGSKIEGILVNEKLKVFKRIRHPTEAKKSRAKIVANILDVIKQLDNKKVKVVGFSMAGFVDGSGKLQMIHNIPSFMGIKFKQTFERLTRKKIVVENDAQCLALAESKIGAAKGKKHVIGIILGTGVGGGLILDGKIYKGSTGGAGHIGHISVDRSGFRCGCGQLGHFESWCSGSSIIKRYRFYGGSDKNAIPSKIFTSEEKAAKKTTDNFVEKTGIAFASIINAFSPEAIVLGGGVSKMDARMYQRVRSSTRKYQYDPIAKKVRILKNKLGDSAGIYGAALLAIQYSSSS